MRNGIFKTDWVGLGEAILTGVVLAILAAFAQVVLSGNFDLFTADWPLIARNMTNIGFVAAVTSLVKDFLSTSSGSLLGITAPNTPAQP